MKKVLIIALVLCFLCGCNYSSNYIDPEDRMIVSSIGVVVYHDSVSCIIEINSKEKEGASIYVGEGLSLDTAIKDATEKISGEIIFSQCPIILIDDSVNKATLEQLFDLCLSRYDFSLSIQFINADVKDAYNKNTLKSGIGYEILKNVRFTDNDLKIAEYGRFSNILNDYTNEQHFKIPHLDISNDAFAFDGLSEYVNGVKINIIDLRKLKNDNS